VASREKDKGRSSESGRRKSAPDADLRTERKRVCVYNQTRECFLSLGVTVADTTLTRLRGLIGRFKLRSDEGIWVVPSSGIHTLGVLVPLDLIYLDASHRVIDLVEHFPTFRIAPIRADSESVLELATHAIYSSQTQVGDQLLICAAEDMERHFRCTAPAVSEQHVVTTEV
jgi:uncharacterized membrane protein (UPF0127 family)